MEIPAKFESVQKTALAALQPIEPAPLDSYFYGERTQAGAKLPAYHLVYFLFVELLRFPSLGESEKVAWSVPIMVDGKNYVVEHRKMGLGLFAHYGKIDEQEAARIVGLIKKGVREANPFFEWLAAEAVANSKLNVVNRSASLFERFKYLYDLYREKVDEAEKRANDRIVEEKISESGTSTTLRFPALELREKADWLGLSAIDAFFSWTEHVFIHLAILQGRITTGTQVSDLAAADWQEKFKSALDLSDTTTKKFFDDLLLIRRQLRNFMAHGAFGKRREAFRFHSRAGAVPVLLPHQRGVARFALSGAKGFRERSATEVIERFLEHIWLNDREPARAYIQDSFLPLILPLASDGTYTYAMRSTEDMDALITRLQYQFDQAANMEW